MKKELVEIRLLDQNTFGQTVQTVDHITKYTVTKEEFMNMLGKEDARVIIKRTKKSEFLFENQPTYIVTYIVNEDTRFAKINLKQGMESLGFFEKPGINDRYTDRLEII